MLRNTGKPPFAGKNPIETITKHLTDAPLPFSQLRPDLYIPEWLEQTVVRALQKDPDRRQQSMEELFDEMIQGVKKKSSVHQINKLSASLQKFDLDEVQDELATAAADAGKARMLVIAIIVASLLAAAAYFCYQIWFATGARSSASPSAPTTNQLPPTAAHTDTQTQPAPGQNAGTDTKHQQPAPPVEKQPSKLDAPPPSSSQLLTTGSASPVVQSKPTVKHQTKRNAEKKKTPAPSIDIAEPVVPRHKRAKDYYDYAAEHEHAGAPLELPTKP